MGAEGSGPVDGDVRRPAVAGRFYPDDPATLDGDVRRLMGGAPAPAKHLAVVAPHAGYVYSGPIAGRVFGATLVPRRVVVLAPNHTGRGKLDAGAVWPRGAFALPNGRVAVDEELCGRLLGGASGLYQEDREAHCLEHAVEVELPFLRARRADVAVTPVVLGPLELDECLEAGAELARAAPPGEELLVVASTDLSHYLSDEEARRVDARAIDPLVALDAERLFRTVHDEQITMCGVVPATVALAYARARGASRAELLGYATSADAYGEKRRVVGYAGVAVD